MSTELAIDPIYDNLGLRTTASGHSVLSLNKQATANAAAAAGVAAVAGISGGSPVTYTMRDRPLPATPFIYEPIQEQQLALMMSSDLCGGAMNDETELLFNKSIEPHPIIVSANAINNNSSSNNNLSSTSSNNNTLEKSTSKVPPRPPPKPKKKMPTISAITENPELHASDGSKLYEDECEDGTEV